MKLNVNLVTFQAEEVDDNFDLDSRNGDRHKFAEIKVCRVGECPSLLLHHPENKFALVYVPGRFYDGRSPLYTNDTSIEVSLNDVQNGFYWPSGLRNLILTLDAVEQYFDRINYPYHPLLWKWFAWGNELAFGDHNRHVEAIEIPTTIREKAEV